MFGMKLNQQFASKNISLIRNSLGEKGSELLLSLCYNPSISRLTVNVLEGKDLMCGVAHTLNRNVTPGHCRCSRRDQNTQPAPDTYVKVCLSYHTKVQKKNVQNVLYNGCRLSKWRRQALSSQRPVLNILNLSTLKSRTVSWISQAFVSPCLR